MRAYRHGQVLTCPDCGFPLQAACDPDEEGGPGPLETWCENGECPTNEENDDGEDQDAVAPATLGSGGGSVG